MDTDIKDIQYKPNFFTDNDTRKFVIIRIEIIQNLPNQNTSRILENCALPFSKDNLKIISRNENDIYIKCYLD